MNTDKISPAGTLAHCRRIWHTAVHDPESGAMTAMTVSMLLLTALGVIAGVAYTKSLLLGTLRGAGIPLTMLALFAWGRFATGAGTQNAPANASLVPGLNRLVRTTAVGAWCLTMLPLAAIALAIPGGDIFILASSAAVTAGGLYRLGRTNFLYAGVPALWIMVYGQGELFMASSAFRMPAIAAIAVACLAFAAYGLVIGFPRGGDAQWDMQIKHAEVKSGDEFSLGKVKRKGKRRRIYSLLLERDMANPALRRHLLMHALGPASERRAFTLPLLGCVLVVFAARPVVDALGLPFDRVASALGGLSGVGLLVLGVIWGRFTTNMWNTSQEQALVKLTPAMPAAPKLNRELGGQMLRACLIDWALFAVVVISAAVLWFGGGTALKVATGLLLGLLSGAGTGLGDYSSRQTFSLAPIIISQVGSLILFIMSLFAMKNPVAWSILMVLMFGQAVATIYSRWQTMLASPVAFPAGRMA